MTVVDDFAPTLYKYRNFENEYHIRILEHNELFFSAPRLFNDPFDCDIPLTVGGESDDEIRAYFERVIQEDLRHHANIKALGMTEQQFIEERTQQFLNDPKGASQLVAQATREEAARFGVFSLTQCWQNILMWGHYSNCHTGYCVGLNTEKLKSYLLYLIHQRSLPGLFVPLTVKYSTDYPEIKLMTAPNQALLDIFRMKYQDWEYEAEVRFLMHNGSVDSTGKATDGTPVTIDRSIIEEVMLGLSTTDENREVIIETLQKNSIKPKLYQLKKVENKFGLDRIEVPY